PKGVRVRCTKCKATFIVRPKPDESTGPESSAAAASPSRAPSKTSKGTASLPGLAAAAAAPKAEEPVPPPLDEGVAGGGADPLSLIRSSSEEGASFDLDALLGKDFDLGLPPPPDDSSEEQGGRHAAAHGESSVGEPEPEQAPVSTQDETAESPPADDPFGPIESSSGDVLFGDSGGTAADQGEPHSPVMAGSEQSPAPRPEAMEQPSSEPHPADPAVDAARGIEPGAAISGPEDVPRESRHEADLSSRLFEGLDLAEGGEAGAKEAPLTSLFEGDLEREDSPVPTEEDVDAALAAFDSAFDSGEGGSPAEIVGTQGSADVVPQEPSEPSVPEPSAESSSPDAGGSLEEDDPFASIQEEPVRLPDGVGIVKEDAHEEKSGEAQPAEGWSEASGSVELDLGQGDETASGETEQVADPFASGLDDLDLSIGTESSGSGLPSSAGEQPAAGGAGPGLDLGEPAKAPGPEGGTSTSDLNLGPDDLPPLSLDDAPSVVFDPGAGEPASGSAQAGSLSFEDADDPFAGLDGPDADAPGDLFGPPTDLSGEGDEEQPVEAGEGATLGRIDLETGSESERPRTSPPSENPLTKERPRRRPLRLVALMANGVFAIALLGVGLVAFVLFRTGGPADASLLSPDRVREAFTPTTTSGPVVHVQSGGRYATRSGEEIIVVRGRVENLSDAEVPVGALAVTGRLLGAEDQVLQEARAILGEMPSSEDLWRISGEPSIRRLRRRAAASGGPPGRRPHCIRLKVNRLS
ncbi:MAG: hypothetical protein ACOCVR_02880, partial [Myxococcota bacterium]